MDNLYSKKYFNSSSEKNKKCFKTYLRFIDETKINLKNKILLDIGCGTGNFLDCLDNKVEKYGCDISEYAVGKCLKRNNKVFLLDLNVSSQIPYSVSFDVITMFDVIEHLVNFKNLEIIIKKKLKKEGIIIITTPNANFFLRFFFNGNAKYYCGEKDKTHRILFTPYTLDFFLRRIGLKKISLSTPYSFYFKNNNLTRRALYGGQIFAIYKK